MRELGPSVDQPGDPIPRVAFRVTRRKLLVLLVAGPPGSGKSTLARELSSKSVRLVSLDHLLWTLPDWCSDERLLKLRGSRAFRENEFGALGELLAAAGAADAVADAVLDKLSARLARSKAVILEGYVLGCGDMASAFAERLTQQGAYVWNVEPAANRNRPLRGWRRLLRQ